MWVHTCAAIIGAANINEMIIMAERGKAYSNERIINKCNFLDDF